MAKPTAANAKTQAAAIAVALNAALHDTEATGIFPDWKHPGHPMRQWHKFVSMDVQGTFSADDDYIDAAYANKVHTKPLSTREDKTTDAPS
jgi:hypothetical protein